MSDDSGKTEARYLIRKHGSYYRPNSEGYTTSAIQAGRYTLAESVVITHPNGPNGPRDGMTYVHEDEVRDDDLVAYRFLQVENAALQSRVAELEAANRGLVRLNEATEARAEAAEAALARALPTTAAERDVLTERSRQIVAEGWNASHDDAHAAGELSVAAACYALLSAGWSRVAMWEIWPKKWGVDWLKDCDPRRAKVKAAALIIADIERLDRARRSGEASGGEP